MGSDPIPYLHVGEASLLAYLTDGFNADMVNTLLTARGISYDTDDDGSIVTVAEEQHKTGDVFTYPIRFQPAENLITVRSRDTTNVGNLLWCINDLAPDLLGTDSPDKDLVGTYSLLFGHPTVEYQMLEDALADDGVHDTDDNGEEYFSVTYTPSHPGHDDPITFDMYPDGVVYPSVVDASVIAEFVDYCNKRLHGALPDAPTEFQIPELPDGWFSPVVAAHPDVMDVITTESRPDDLEAVAADTEYAVNEVVVMLLDVIGAGRYAIDQLDDDGRAAFYNTYKDDNSLFHDLLLGDGGELIDRGEFLAEPIWSPVATTELVREKARFRDLHNIAESYEDHTLESGEVWRVHSQSAHVWLHVELTEKAQLDGEQFPHEPIWVGEVVELEDGHHGDIPGEATESVGDTIVVDGEELDERITPVS